MISHEISNIENNNTCDICPISDLSMNVIISYNCFRDYIEENCYLFEDDIDRLIFSQNLRVLSHKTQLVPLAMPDFAENRLSHSLQVSRIAKKLGRFFIKHYTGIDNSTHIPVILEAAGLAHDI